MDNLLHFTVSALILLSITLILFAGTSKLFTSIRRAIYLTIAIGFIKEIHDLLIDIHQLTDSFVDMSFNFIGVFTASVLLIYMCDRTGRFNE